jgi:endonuclease/exonuclease/phosphatase family metal-dependent hydrolase
LQKIRRVVLVLCLLAAVSWSPDTGLAPALAEPAGDSLTVMSLNLALRDDVHGIVEAIRAIGGDKADILVLQEVVEAPGTPRVADGIAAQLGFEAVFRPGFSVGGGRSAGLATLSRLPILDARVLDLKRFSLAFRSRERTALAVTLETPSGPLRTYNVHLDTRINGGDRVDQIADVIQDIDGGPGRAIVAGDFNTNDHLWLFHTIPLPFLGRQGSGLERYMARHGLLSAFQHGATHDALRMRLDWMFLKGMRATDRSIHPTNISDHHALKATLTN